MCPLLEFRTSVRRERVFPRNHCLKEKRLGIPGTRESPYKIAKVFCDIFISHICRANEEA